jgi:hypothetical protein
MTCPTSTRSRQLPIYYRLLSQSASQSWLLWAWCVKRPVLYTDAQIQTFKALEQKEMKHLVEAMNEDATDEDELEELARDMRVSFQLRRLHQRRPEPKKDDTAETFEKPWPPTQEEQGRRTQKIAQLTSTILASSSKVKGMEVQDTSWNSTIRHSLGRVKTREDLLEFVRKLRKSKKVAFRQQGNLIQHFLYRAATREGTPEKRVVESTGYHFGSQLQELL